jgi:hypothetical protein
VGPQYRATRRNVSPEPYRSNDSGEDQALSRIGLVPYWPGYSEGVIWTDGNDRERQSRLSLHEVHGSNGAREPSSTNRR